MVCWTKTKCTQNFMHNARHWKWCKHTKVHCATKKHPLSRIQAFCHLSMSEIKHPPPHLVPYIKKLKKDRRLGDKAIYILIRDLLYFLIKRAIVIVWNTSSNTTLNFNRNIKANYTHFLQEMEIYVIFTVYSAFSFNLLIIQWDLQLNISWFENDKSLDLKTERTQSKCHAVAQTFDLSFFFLPHKCDRIMMYEFFSMVKKKM